MYSLSYQGFLCGSYAKCLSLFLSLSNVDVICVVHALIHDFTFENISVHRTHDKLRQALRGGKTNRNITVVVYHTFLVVCCVEKCSVLYFRRDNLCSINKTCSVNVVDAYCSRQPNSSGLTFLAILFDISSCVD